MDPQPTDLRKGVFLGTLVGLALQLVGFLFVLDGSAFGLVIFLFVPFVSGFAVAAIVRGPTRIAACSIAGLILNFSILLFTGLEGFVCCLFAAPIMAVGMAIGGCVGYVVRGRIIDASAAPNRSTAMAVLSLPLFIAAADRVERPYRATQQREVITTETVVPAAPEETWDVLARMPRLDGPRPFLLRLGLPVAYRCELDRAEVGGRRVCYFDAGVIAQEVTVWERPSRMGLKITENTLPGRHWLTFDDAAYELEGEGNGTRVTRHTTIGTRLYPRWYWRPLERWGVASEHEFVFANLRRRADER